MKRVSILDQLRAILLLPVMVTLVIPALLLTVSDGWTQATLINGLSVWGFFFVGMGVTMLVWTVRLFHRKGDGTPAPWNPPRKLVVAGPYRHVRNPMISGVLMILLGESMIFGSWLLFAWWGLFWGLNHIHFLLVEEPGLTKRFGEDYVRYREHVPRWIPRWTAWEPETLEPLVEGERKTVSHASAVENETAAGRETENGDRH